MYESGVETAVCHHAMSLFKLFDISLHKVSPYRRSFISITALQAQANWAEHYVELDALIFI